MRFTSSLHTSLFASLLFVLGGCAGNVDIAAPDPTPSPTPAPTPTTPPVIPPPTKSISCGLGDEKDPTRVLLAWTRGPQVMLTRADGSSFVAHAFASAAGADPAAAPTIQLATRGDFVAAIGTSYAEGSLVSEALLVARDGKVLWSETRTGEAFSVLYLGDGGALAIGLSSNLGSTLVVGPAGKIGEYPEQLPISAPTKGGRVAVQHDFSVYVQPTFGWLDTASGKVTSFAYPTNQSYPITVEGGVAYVTPDVVQGGSIFVSEGDAVTGFELGADYAALGAPARHGFVVIRSQWGDPESTKWLAQPGSQPAPISPPGLTPFGAMYYEGVRAGDLGELLAPMRDEHLGGLYRSVDLGATWALVGPSFTGITDLPFVQRAGTYVIQANDTPGYFPMDPWSPPASGGPAPEHAGPANELVRPADGIARVLPETAQSFALSDDGGCLTYQDGDHLFAGGVASGKMVDLGATMAVYGSQVVWLP